MIKTKNKDPIIEIAAESANATTIRILSVNLI